MQKITFKSLAVTVVTAFCFVMVGSFASAAPSAQAEEARMNADERKSSAQAKSAEAKLEACEKREEKISMAMMRIAQRGEKQLDVFNKIAERTKAFYEDKGKVLDNYDALVEEVDQKKSGRTSSSGRYSSFQ